MPFEVHLSFPKLGRHLRLPDDADPDAGVRGRPHVTLASVGAIKLRIGQPCTTYVTLRNRFKCLQRHSWWSVSWTITVCVRTERGVSHIRLSLVWASCDLEQIKNTVKINFNQSSLRVFSTEFLSFWWYFIFSSCLLSFLFINVFFCFNIFQFFYINLRYYYYSLLSYSSLFLAF